MSLTKVGKEDPYRLIGHDELDGFVDETNLNYALATHWFTCAAADRGPFISWRVKRTSHSHPPPPPLLPALTPSADEHEVSGGWVEGESNRGGPALTFPTRELVARSLKWPPSFFGGLFKTPVAVTMVEPPVSYLEPHGPPPLPARQTSQLGLLAVLVWASSYAISSTTVYPPAPSPPDCHRHGEKKGHSRRARSSRRSKRLPERGAPGRRQPSRR
jgi:hypothetical protein